MRPILSASGPKMKAPDHQAEQAGAEQRRQLGRRNTPLGSECWGDEADCGGVEAVDRHDQEAERYDPDLVGRQLMVIHEILDVNGAC